MWMNREKKGGLRNNLDPTDRGEEMTRQMKIKLIIVLFTAMLLDGCAYKFLFWERNIWEDLHGIVTMVEPADLTLYRELLPEQFSMPDQPMVGVFVIDYLDTEPWLVTFTRPLRPYLEASIFLRCKYMDEAGWYSLTMPVTTKAANIGGRRIGFPKYVADSIVLDQTDTGWIGKVVHQGKSPISLEFTAEPLANIGELVPIHDEFMKGRGEAELKGPVILLVPPGEGPKVRVNSCSPPPLASRETGMVRIVLAEPWNGLVPAGTVSPGLFQRFTLGADKK